MSDAQDREAAGADQPALPHTTTTASGSHGAAPSGVGGVVGVDDGDEAISGDGVGAGGGAPLVYAFPKSKKWDDTAYDKYDDDDGGDGGDGGGRWFGGGGAGASGGWGSSSWGWGYDYGRREPKPDYDNMTLEQKRARYKCGARFVTLDDIVPWSQFGSVVAAKPPALRIPVDPRSYSMDSYIVLQPEDVTPKAAPSDAINRKVSMFSGDITRLEIDSIVNAANSSLLGGGGIDHAIHSAAGTWLKDYCATLGGCKTGFTKITDGFDLPAKKILHTVGPVGEYADQLTSCYRTTLQLVEEHKLRHVAFCCVATGIYGYPLREATQIALSTVRQWLETSEYARSDEFERAIFCVFLTHEEAAYKALMPAYFPLAGASDGDAAAAAAST